MIRIVLFSSLILLLSACREEIGSFPKPKDLVTEDKMVTILKELSVLEAHIQMKYVQVPRYKNVMERSGRLVLQKHNVTLQQFESSLDYYGSRQEKMQGIYARVLDSLNLMSGKLEQEKEASPAVAPPDSAMKKLPGLVRMSIDKKK